MINLKYDDMEFAYPYGEAQEVFELIGGKVLLNNFSNSCTIRISRCLNYSGHKVEYIPPNLTVSGDDGYWYIYRVRELIKYLVTHFGQSDIVSTEVGNYRDTFYGKKGIIVFEVSGWEDASGHATLWDGYDCVDACYFEEAKKVHLWQLEED